MRKALAPQISLILVVAASLLSGCATVTRGTKDTLVVESDPPGAKVKLSNGLYGKTPTSFKLSRKDHLTVTIEKAGYESLSIDVRPQISGAGGAGMAGNVLVGGIIGVAVDAGSGAMNDLKPNPISVKLNPISKTAIVPDVASSPAEPLPVAEDVPVIDEATKVEEFVEPEESPVAKVADSSVQKQLKRLDKLLADGVIPPAEHARKKNDLLRGL